MTSIKLVVLRHTKAKDGSFKIRISIGHKSETHYIITKYRVASLSNFVNGVVVGQPDAKAINVKLRQLLNEYDARLDRIPNTGELSCEELRNLLRDMPSENDNYTLMQVFNIYANRLNEENRQSTASLYQFHVQRFIKFTNGDIHMSAITPRLVDNYIHHLRINGASNAYINISLAPIRTIINFAIKMQYVHYDINPFTYTPRLKSLPRDLALPLDDMRLLFHYQPTRIKTQRNLDIFKLSYILGGMNLADIIQYDFRKPDICYIRQKTKRSNLRETKFSIPPEARPIIERYINKKTGRLEIMGKCRYDTYIGCIDRSLKTLAKKLNLSHQRISIYTARKSFVQHGFDLGIPLEILEYCTGQTMKYNRPIFNYAQIMSTHADNAIRKILDNIKEPASLTDDGQTNNQKH